MKKFLVISLIVILVLSVGAVVALKVLDGNHEHSYGEWETKTPATCTEAEVEVRKCSCGDEQTREGDAALGHTYGEWETKTPATCTEAEVEVRKCSCGEEETREGDAALGHTYTSVVTSPTCTEAGYTTYTCYCGDSYKGDEVKATGHNFVNEVAEEKYLATNECGKQPTYYKSCSCGEKGSETFAYGEVNGHVYTSVITAPTCTETGYTTYTCTCGDSYVGDETKALGHNMVTVSDDTHHWTECDREGCDEATEKLSHLAASISATSKLESPMERMTVKASDLTVTATCQCGHSFAITEGVELENATLVLGENTVTVKYGELSTTVSINAEKFNLTVGGSISDDTYVSSANSSSKDKDNSSATELKAYSNSFRVYFRVNLKDALNNEFFNSNNAKVQLILTMINEGTNTGDHFDENGNVSDKIYTLKAYNNTDKAFKDITWNGVSDTELHWHQGSILVYDVANVGDNVTVADGKIIFTVAYSQIAEFVDEDGTLLLAFASPNTKSLSINSLEAADEALKPAVNVVINDDHLHVFGEWETKTPATCTEKEVQVRKCACGDEETREGAALGHTLTQVDAQAPTCTAIGWDAYEYCSVCDYTTYLEKAAPGHTLTQVDAQAPTCTAIGWDAYEYCSACDYTTYVEKAAPGHTLTQVDAQAPTCIAIGWDAYEYCSVCNYTTYVEKAALGHAETSHDAKAPTCTDIGFDAYVTCSRCDYTTYVEKAALGHAEVSHDAKAPTCTDIGFDAYVTCSRCDYTTYVEKAALGHAEISHDAKAPTCTDSGFDAYVTCSRCDYTTYVEKEALGHDYQWKVDVEPTFTTIGTKHEECTRCGDKRNANTEIPAKTCEHSLTETPAKDATCLEAGNKAYYTCSICGNVYSDADGLLETTVADSATPAKGHTAGETVVENNNAPTCTATGSYENVVYCTVCNAEISRETITVVANGHTEGDTVVENSKAPTCTATGSYEKVVYCTVCNAEISRETITVGALGHTLAQVDAQAPTCTAIGWDAYEYCSVCDYTTYEEKVKLGHDMKHQNDAEGCWTACDREGCSYSTEKLPYSAISATSEIESPIATMVVDSSDLTVTVTCQCGESYTVTDGIELDRATLKEGNNTVTVKYGELSTTVSIEAGELNVVINGTVTDDTYVSASSNSDKAKEFTTKTDLNAYSSSFRIYFRINIKDALDNRLFNSDYAKVQLILAITNNTITEDTIFTLKAYAPNSVDFTNLTWNSVDNKSTPLGAYSDLHWGNGNEIVSSLQGDSFTISEGYLTITVAYSQLADYVDKDGNLILAFASPTTKGLKFGSLENSDAAKKPAVKVLLNEDHVHVFNQENVADKYFVSANCEETAKYYKSCSCGEHSASTFEYGEVIEHIAGEAADCENDQTCTVCGKVLVNKLGHTEGDTVVENNNAPTCTATGSYDNVVYCTVCNAELSRETITVAANGHTEGEIVVENNVDPTCTATGSYDNVVYCTVCNAELSRETITVDANGHTEVIDAAKDSSCTETGLTEGKHCSVCGEVIVAQNTVPASGHKYDGESDLECNACGSKRNCLHNETITLDAVAPTCTATGLTEGKQCNICKDIITAQEVVDALGHTEEKIPAVAPTCTNTGLTAGVKCSVCNEVLTAQTGIDALGHTEEEIPAVAPTCTESGLTAGVKCSVCGEVTVAQNTVSASGHKYDDDSDLECNACGYTKTEVTVAGTIKDDTYVDSGNKDKDFSTNKTELNVRNKGTTNWRSYFRFNFSNVLSAEGFVADKANAKVTFTFAVTAGGDTITDDTTFTFYAFNVDETTDAVAFSDINWTSVKDGAYAQLGFNNGCATSLVGDNNITYADGLLTITVNYSDIEGCMDANGNCIFGLTTSSTDLKVASMENKTYAAPAVSVTYTK